MISKLLIMLFWRNKRKMDWNNTSQSVKKDYVITIKIILKTFKVLITGLKNEAHLIE